MYLNSNNRCELNLDDMYGSKCNDTGADANANMNGSSSVPILPSMEKDMK